MHLKSVILFFVLLFSIGEAAAQKYSLMLTREQISAVVDASILQWRGKKCVIRKGLKPTTCIDYCRLFYAYVEALPYKNAQLFNPETGLCQPKQICPKIYGVRYDDKTNKCLDMLTGMKVDPVNATFDKQSQRFETSFICVHGKVAKFNGLNDCICDLGWTTRIEGNLVAASPQFKKCNDAVHISLYFPATLQVFYDPGRDNKMPGANNRYYWTQILVVGVRRIKYSILNFFQPYEAQMVSLILPRQEMVSGSDWIWFSWVIIALFLLIVISLYQKVVHGSRLDALSS